MIEFLTNLSASTVSTWGYVVIFLSSYFEPIPFLGILDPGSTISNFAGFFVYQEVLNFWVVITVSWVALFMGDMTAYLLGRHFGYNFLLKFSNLFSLDVSRLERVRKFVENHTGKALTFGRILFPVRNFAPFLAGTFNYKITRFVPFSILGTFTWSVGTVLLGFFFGIGFNIVAVKVGKIFLGAIVIAILLAIAFRSFGKGYKVFKHYSSYVFGALVVSIFLLGKLIEDLLSKTFFAQADAVAHFYTSSSQFHTNILDILFQSASFLFNPTSVIVLSLAVLVSLLYKKLNVDALLFFSTTVTAFLLTSLIKNILKLPRPEEAYRLYAETSYSFPSGHTSAATVFFLILLFILLKHARSPSGKFILWVIALTGIVAVGLSRMYLGFHWLSDILGGMALGILCVTGAILFFELARYIFGKLKRVKTETP